MPSFEPFFDRVAELGQLRSWIAAAEGPVTIHGPCGSGKTSLARRFASEPEGRWAWCDLWQARDAGEVRVSLAETIGRQVPEAISPGGSADFARRLRKHFDGVVLDAAESLVDAGGEFPAWVESLAWEVPVVVTSTSRLRVSTEHVVPLGGLPPDPARRLFAYHVRRADPAFTVDGAGSRAVTELLEALDRLPLPIVAAAEQVEILGVESLLAQVREGWEWTRGIHGCEDLSRWPAAAWDRLDADLQYVLVQCAAFSGDFHIEDAEAVVRTRAGTPLPVPAFATLVHRALIQGIGTPTDGRRFRLSTPVRQFLRARALWTEVRDTVKERHARWYARGKHGGSRAAGFMIPTYELPDLVAASAQVAPHDEGSAAQVRVVAALSAFSGESEALRAVSEEAHRARERGDFDVFARAVLTRVGMECHWNSVESALAILALALAEEDRLSPGHRGTALGIAALLEAWRGHLGPARAWAQRAREALSSDTSPNLRGEALIHLACYHHCGGRIDKALQVIHEAGLYVTEPWTRAYQVCTLIPIEAEAGVSSTVSEADFARHHLPYSLPMLPSWVAFGRVLAQHAVAASPELHGRLEAAGRDGEDHGSRLFRHWLDAHRGWLLWDLGERDRAIATTRVAIEGLRQMGAVGSAVPPTLALSWWLAVEGRSAEGQHWWQWATGTETASTPLSRALRTVFGNAHPDLDPGDAAVAPGQEQWARVRIARAMVEREAPSSTVSAPSPVELLEPAAGGGGLARRDGRAVQVSVSQYALLVVLVERWVEDEGLPPAVRGYASSSVLLATLPFDTPYPRHLHVKQLVKRTRERLKPLGIDIEGRQGFGYRLKLGDRG